MSERGVFAVDRGVFDHECFAPEPFTEREAWIWMISAAAFRPCRVRVGRHRVELARGQFAHSLRFMAEKFKWSEASVRRFIVLLKSEKMVIDAQNDASVTVLTICNYAEYQRVSLPDVTPKDADTTQTRRKEEDTKSIELVGGGDVRARALVSKEALDFAMELATICGHDREFLPPKWVSAGPAMRVQMMLDAGYRIETMRETARATMTKKRDGPPQTIKYFDEIFARAHAAQAPLPVIVVSGEAKTITIQGGHSGGIREDRSISRAAGRLAEQGFSFGPRPSLVATEPGADVIRLLPERRSG